MAHRSYLHGLSDCSPLLQVRTPRLPTFPTTFRAADCRSILQIQVQISLMPIKELPLGGGGLRATHCNFFPLQLLLGDSNQEPQGAGSSFTLDESRTARHAKPHHKPARTWQTPWFLRQAEIWTQVVPILLQQYTRWFLEVLGCFCQGFWYHELHWKDWHGCSEPSLPPGSFSFCFVDTSARTVLSKQFIPQNSPFVLDLIFTNLFENYYTNIS